MIENQSDNSEIKDENVSEESNIPENSSVIENKPNDLPKSYTIEHHLEKN